MKAAADIIRRAADLVEGDRAEQHGDAAAVMARIAAHWSLILDIEIDADQVAMLLALAKIVRSESGGHNPDDYIDIAGYAGIAGALRARQEAARPPGGTEGTGQDRTRRPGLDPGPNAPIDPVCHFYGLGGGDPSPGADAPPSPQRGEGRAPDEAPAASVPSPPTGGEGQGEGGYIGLRRERGPEYCEHGIKGDYCPYCATASGRYAYRDGKI